MRLESRLRAFAAVARRGSFSLGAEELVISQPAVSKQVAELERELGVILILRRPQRIVLTPAGEFVADYVHRAEGLLAQARRGVRAHAGLECGRLVIGSSGTPGDYVLPAVIAAFHLQHPGVAIEVRLTNSARAVAAVVAHEVELGIVGGFSAASGLEEEPLLVDEVLLVRSPALPAPSRSQLRSMTWVMREEGSGTRSAMEGAATTAGIQITRVLALPSWEMVKRTVVAGGGIGACSRLAVGAELRDGSLVELKVRGWSANRLISIVRPVGVPLTPAAEQFVRLLREHYPGERR